MHEVVFCTCIRCKISGREAGVRQKIGSFWEAPPGYAGGTEQQQQKKSQQVFKAVKKC